MKRDMELVRAILLDIEENAAPGVPYSPKANGRSEDELFYHVHMLCGGGYLEGQVIHGMSGPMMAAVCGITWAGHDYLDAIRDDSVWSRVKAKAGTGLPAVPIEVIKALAVAIMKDRLGLDGTAQANARASKETGQTRRHPSRYGPSGRRANDSLDPRKVWLVRSVIRTTSSLPRTGVAQFLASLP